MFCVSRKTGTIKWCRRNTKSNDGNDVIKKSFVLVCHAIDHKFNMKMKMWKAFCGCPFVLCHTNVYIQVPFFTSPLVSFGSPYAIECSYGNNHIAKIKLFSHSLPLCLLCLFSVCEWKPLMCSNFSPCFVRCWIYPGMLVSHSHIKNMPIVEFFYYFIAIKKAFSRTHF